MMGVGYGAAMRCPPGKTPKSYNWLGIAQPYYTDSGYLERERQRHPDLWIEAGPYEWWIRVIGAPAYLLDRLGPIRGTAILAALACGSLVAFGFLLGRIVP